MAERKVTEFINTIPVGGKIAVIDIPNNFLSGSVAGLGKANCMERVGGEGVLPLTFQRIFDPADPKTSVQLCDKCPLKKNCVIVERLEK